MVKNGHSPVEYFSGDKLYQQRARVALPLLVRQAMQSTPVFYSDLAAELGMPNERNLNYVLDYIGRAIVLLSKDWGKTIPPIQCLVINKRYRMPGEGIEWNIITKADFLKLPRKEQQRIAKLELEQVFAYRGWHSVLKAFKLSPTMAEYAPELSEAKSVQLTGESRASSFGVGGESPEHKRLKQYVAEHPEALGLRISLRPGNTEKPLLSGDVLDVFFRDGADHIAVEVKSARSNESDIVRGIFQCVKYKAVLEAQQAAEGLSQSARAILVMEAKLPSKFHALKNVLGIELVDEIKPC